MPRYSLRLAGCLLVLGALSLGAQDSAQASLLTSDQLNQLVAPIALYPDALVAQMLAASTYPVEVVEANRWLSEHQSLTGRELAQAVDSEAWDVSVKSLTAFPSVLANMDKNLSWTSALGDAYTNQPDDVMTAVQSMRQRAEQAGTLKSTPQETVSTQDDEIVVDPVDDHVVYLPTYDPWVVYGDPLVAWPGWYDYPGLYVDGPGLFFGIGLSVGWFDEFGWGWQHWHTDWHDRRPDFDHHPYVSRSRTFIDARRFSMPRPDFSGPSDVRAPRSGGAFERGAGAPVRKEGLRSGAFSGYDHGAVVRQYESRGASSFHGGGGGFHGGHR